MDWGAGELSEAGRGLLSGAGNRFKGEVSQASPAEGEGQRRFQTAQ